MYCLCGCWRPLVERIISGEIKGSTIVCGFCRFLSEGEDVAGITDATAGSQRRGRRVRGGSQLAVEMPDLGCWARQLRAHLGLSRPAAAARLHLSVDTLKSIERNSAAAPSAVTLDRIIAGYDLGPAQQRFTRELAQPAVPLRSVGALRELLAVPEQQARLSRLGREGLACAFIDPLWNVVAANDPFSEAFPGVDDFDGNLALWHFRRDTSKAASASIFVFADRASAFFTATLRGALGRHRDAPQALALLRRLRTSATFTSVWTSSVAVAYGRSPDEHIHLRDAGTGEPYSMSVQLGAVAGSRDMRLCLAYRLPYTGPALS